jgi:hypothetical protein
MKNILQTSLTKSLFTAIALAVLSRFQQQMATILRCPPMLRFLHHDHRIQPTGKCPVTAWSAACDGNYLDCRAM